MLYRILNQLKLFGKAYQKRINYIAARKAGISPDKFKKLPPEEQKQMVDNLTGDDLFDSLINNPPYKGDLHKSNCNQR